MKIYRIETEYDKKCAETRAKNSLRAAKNYAKNREKHIAKSMEWQKSNPELMSAYRSARRARLYEAPGDHTSQDLKQIMILQRGKCACCKKSIKNSYHADHIMPLVRGGANDKENIQLLCPKCNWSKHARDPVDFMRSRGYLL